MTSLKPRRFGIELELSRQLLCINNADKNYSKHWTWIENLLYNLYEQRKIQRGWTLKLDTSCGGEVVSPILFGRDGLAEAALISSRIQEHATKVGLPAVDAECGLHLHFDSADMKPRQLSNLFVLLHMAEPIIYSMYPNRNPQYCAPIEINMRLASKFRDWTDVRDTWYRGENNVKNRGRVYSRNFINGSNAGDNYDGTRYHGFNIHCYWRQGTVEFRYGIGTLDPLHISAYYQMCLSMVNTAMSKKKIKITGSSMDMDYKSLVGHVSTNYRFRKIISKLCKECSFSRDTIKLIMDLVKKNKPYLLEKPPTDKNITVIDRKNAGQYVYRLPDGKHYLANGRIISDRKLSSYLGTSKVIDCDYNWHGATFGPREGVPIVSINPLYKMLYTINVNPSGKKRNFTLHGFPTDSFPTADVFTDDTIVNESN